MAFNAMKATLVEYEDKGGDIIIGDITINNGATKATPVTSRSRQTLPASAMRRPLMVTTLLSLLKSTARI